MWTPGSCFSKKKLQICSFTTHVGAGVTCYIANATISRAFWLFRANCSRTGPAEPAWQGFSAWTRSCACQHEALQCDGEENDAQEHISAPKSLFLSRLAPHCSLQLRNTDEALHPEIPSEEISAPPLPGSLRSDILTAKVETAL